MRTASVTPTRSAEPLVTHRFVRELMGMPWSLHVRAPRGADGSVAFHVDRAYDRLAWIDRVFSPFRADSVVNRLDRDEMTLGDAPAVVRRVARLCDRAEAVTGGAFSARFRDPAADGPAWDPTGLVKGWAIAEAGRLLAAVDGSHWSVNAGGDVAAGSGAVANTGAAEPWRIGVEDPASPGRVAEVVELYAGAVCTSGTAARGTHLLDPHSGLPVGATGSVTVVGPDVVWADVWATALFVGGDDAARRFAAAAPGYRVIDLRASSSMQ